MRLNTALLLILKAPTYAPSNRRIEYEVRCLKMAMGKISDPDID